MQSSRLREFPRPIWDGGDLRGKTILLYPEQGFGDVIQFARFIPQLIALQPQRPTGNGPVLTQHPNFRQTLHDMHPGYTDECLYYSTAVDDRSIALSL